MEPHLAVWRAWLDQAAKGSEGSGGGELLNEAGILLGVLVNAVMWEEGSKYGRFAGKGQGKTITPWWNAACGEALKCLRKARGSGDKRLAWKCLAREMSAAKSGEWLGEASEVADPLQSGKQAQKLRSAIKKRIRPVGNVGVVMRVGEHILKEEEAQQVWTEYFKAQTSKEGPTAAENILNQIRRVKEAQPAEGTGSGSGGRGNRAEEVVSEPEGGKEDDDEDMPELLENEMHDEWFSQDSSVDTDQDLGNTYSNIFIIFVCGGAPSMLAACLAIWRGRHELIRL